MTQSEANQSRSDADSGGQVSQGPSGLNGAEDLGGADAVPDTPDTNFHQDTTDTEPDRRGAALNKKHAPDDRRPDA